MIAVYIQVVFSQNYNFLPQIAAVPDNSAVYLHIQRLSTESPIKKEKKKYIFIAYKFNYLRSRLTRDKTVVLKYQIPGQMLSSFRKTRIHTPSSIFGY